MHQPLQLEKLGKYITERKEKNKAGKQLAVYSISNVHGFIRSDRYFNKRVYSKDLSTYKLVNNGNIAYNPYRINVGSIALFQGNDQGLVSPAYVVFKVSDPNILHPTYLFYLLQSDNYKREIKRYSSSRGSVRRSLSFNDLSKFPIHIPSMHKQMHIVDLMNSINSYLELSKKELDFEEERLTSILEHLFSKGLDIATTKQQNSLVVPSRWEVVKLKSLLSEKLKNGHSAKETNGSGVRTLTLTAITQRDFSVKNTKITVADPKKVENIWLKPDDILIERANTLEFVGLGAIYEGENNYAIFSDLMVRVRVNKGTIMPRFFAYYLLSSPSRNYFRKNAKGTSGSMPKVDHTIINELDVPVPPLPEQKEIIDILDMANRNVDLIRKEIALTEEMYFTTLEKLIYRASHE